MYFADLPEITEAAVRAAKRDGIAFYILCNPSRKEKMYTALPSRGFGLPAGFYIEELIRPDVERIELERSEKTSTNGF